MVALRSKLMSNSADSLTLNSETSPSSPTEMRKPAGPLSDPAHAGFGTLTVCLRSVLVPQLMQHHRSPSFGSRVPPQYSHFSNTISAM